MNRQWDPELELLRRAAGRHFFGREPEPRQARLEEGSQPIPVNVYETGEDVVLVAPMPGVEAENIDIEVVGTHVTLRAGMRGPHQEDRKYLLHEWSYGPYERQLELPYEVDAAHANASHNNGVLAVTLPKAAKNRAVRVPLRRADSGQSVHQGHSGHNTSREGLEDR